MTNVINVHEFSFYCAIPTGAVGILSLLWQNKAMRVSKPSRISSALLLVFTMLPIAILASPTEKLANFHQTIERKFKQVKHISAEQLAAIRKDQVVIFDVREAEEFEVSHLDAAVRVTPDISDKEFMQKFSHMTKDKAVVFYCSVGYRSSQLAESVQENLKAIGSKEIYNLEGGIFYWHNNHRKLVNKNGASDDIHPYDQYWGRLLERPDRIRYRSAN